MRNEKAIQTGLRKRKAVRTFSIRGLIRRSIGYARESKLIGMSRLSGPLCLLCGTLRAPLDRSCSLLRAQTAPNMYISAPRPLTHLPTPHKQSFHHKPFAYPAGRNNHVRPWPWIMAFLSSGVRRACPGLADKADGAGGHGYGGPCSKLNTSLKSSKVPRPFPALKARPTRLPVAI